MFEANRKLEDLTPATQSRVVKWLSDCKAAGLKVLVTETRRSKPRQFWLWSKGRIVTKKQEVDFLGFDDPNIDSNPKEKQVTWTLKSKHLEGKAVDFCFLTPDGKATYSGDWSKAFDIAEDCGLVSLFRKTGVDKPHLELNEDWISDGDAAKVIELEAEFTKRAAVANGALASLNEIKKELSDAKGVTFKPYKITIL